MKNFKENAAEKLLKAKANSFFQDLFILSILNILIAEQCGELWYLGKKKAFVLTCALLSNLFFRSGQDFDMWQD